MPSFIEAAQLDARPTGTRTCVAVAGRDVPLFNVNGTIHAMEDSYAHQEGSLGTSPVDGKVVTCRAHGWRFDVTLQMGRLRATGDDVPSTSRRALSVSNPTDAVNPPVRGAEVLWTVR
jgi:hypothetical protein